MANLQAPENLQPPARSPHWNLDVSGLALLWILAFGSWIFYPAHPCRIMFTAIAASSIEMIFEIARIPVEPIRLQSFSL